MIKRVLVTGGAGFLGSHLCERLLASGHRVICVDDFFTGRRHNIAPLLKQPRFESLQLDVCEPLFLEVDQIFHLACPASPIHYQRDPVRTIRTCVQGTLNSLELARRAGARILIASTSEVYGDPAVHPQPESYWGNVNPIGPRACYDEGKRCAEALAMCFARQHHVEVRIARIFNTYGPRMLEDDGRVVSNFVMQCLRERPLTIFGDGTQTRSFCYVDDLVDGMLRLMDSDVDLPLNLGNPEEHSVLGLAKRIKHLTGSKSPLVFQPLPVDDPKQRRPDIGHARARLGWAPTVSLVKGLERTIADFRQRLVPSAVSPLRAFQN